MFEIFVKNLRLYGYHGVKPEEKTEGQYFIFNIKIKINKESFKDGDNICQTVNYSEVIRIIKEINSKNKFDLIETLAEKIAVKISEMSCMINKVKVKVEKAEPPINEKLDSVGVSFETKLSQKIKNGKIVYLSIGTNIGNKLENIKNALNLLKKSGIFKILMVSSIYETEPMYFKNQENFFNIAVKVSVCSSVDPFVLLGYVKSMEYKLGREKQIKKNGPRIIDIDILHMDGAAIDSDILKIPHPRISERNFVMIPLSEIAPDFMINGVNIMEYVNKNIFNEKVVKINQNI
ncbi:MAG: 2-amino-4-hydroxy-6-hydroxymethyldihydropteridine diphosphokinase [Actinomycetota bacterium]|nr:2-amino-4-hydroxy-6-hydroxymethyldihydropteridine diphosphokinase [Actinomycetota bacterium]